MEAGGEGGHAGAERGGDGGGAGHQGQADPDPRHRDRGEEGETRLRSGGLSVKVSGQWQECQDSDSTFVRSNPSTPSSDKVRNFVDKLDKLVHLDSQKEAHKQEVERDLHCIHSLTFIEFSAFQYAENVGRDTSEKLTFTTRR